MSLIERSNIQCPFLRGSFIRGSTVDLHVYVMATSPWGALKSCSNIILDGPFKFGNE